MCQNERRVSLLLSVPQYMSRFMNITELLSGKTSIPCPLPGHEEKIGQSFSYNTTTGYWACYGKCNRFRQTIVDLHQINLNLSSRIDALEHLLQILNLTLLPTSLVFEDYAKLVTLRDNEIHYRTLLYRAQRLALRDIDSALELDYILSYRDTIDNLTNELKGFLRMRGNYDV